MLYGQIRFMLIADGENIPAALTGLLEGLETTLATGDTKRVIAYLKHGETRLKELLPKIHNNSLRDAVKKVLPKVADLIQELRSGDANLSDVNKFVENVKERARQRLVERIREIAQG